MVSREAEIAEPPEPLLDLIDQVIGGGWQGTATELLERLRAAGRALYICTSKPKAVADRVLDYLGVAKAFDRRAGSSPSCARRTRRKMRSMTVMTMMTIPPPRRKYRHYRHWDQRAAVMGMAEMVPVWEKANLTLEEAAAYFGIGINKLRDLTNEESCPFVLWNGSKRLIKRKALEKYLETAYSI